MPLGVFVARRDPWWEIDGPAARRERRRRTVMSFAAFVISFVAATGSAYAWAFHLGFVGALALRLPL